jgi:hypothetical protein
VLEFEDGEPGVEEKVEFFDPGLKDPGSDKMAKFMEYHQD